jgi:type IV secretion system protein VirB10
MSDSHNYDQDNPEYIPEDTDNGSPEGEPMDTGEDNVFSGDTGDIYPSMEYNAPETGENSSYSEPDTENPEDYENEDDYSGITEPDDSENAAMEDTFSQNSPDESGEEEGEGGENGGEAAEAALSTHRNIEEEVQQPYAGNKKPPDSVIKSKPTVLNRQLILYIIGGIFIFALIFATFILPILQTNSKKAEQKKKQAPTAVSPGNYSDLVPRSDAKNIIEDGEPSSDDSRTRFWEEEDDEDIINSLPPVNERFQNQAPSRNTTSSGGTGGGGYVRPDTRNDKLQSKNISGIKGLTPSQKQYLSGPEPGQIAYMQMPAAQQTDPSNPYAQFGMPPKEEYMNQMLAMQQQQQQQYYGNNSGYTAQNDQSGKMAFYSQGRENSGNGYWLSPTSIWQGTIFEATLTSRINTDLPGECTALISKNVYSTQDGKYLLIPQNSRLLGTYNSSISYSQKRVQVAWHTLIRPDGYYINLGNMQATDTRGATGLPGLINEHPFQYFKAILLLSAMNIVNSELSYSMADTNNQYVQNVMANTQEIANALGGKIIDRALDVQPTITIKEGTRINIVANNNLVLPPMQPYPVKYPYQRRYR